MANIVYIATSIDGFIATKDGGIDWLHEIPNPTGSDFGFAEFMNGIDALVMGRKTFETVLNFGEWPYSKPVFVWSTKLTKLEPRLAGKAELIHGEPHTIVETLNSRGYKNLYIDGGKTIQAFLKDDLIDELIITKIPILLGEGIPLFGPLDKTLKFHHVGTHTHDGGLVKSHYRKMGLS